MVRLTKQSRARLLLFAYALGAAVFIFLLPARLTAPARIVFTQAVGPLELIAYKTGGDALAGASTLRDAILAQELDRRLEGEIVRLRNECAALREELRRERLRGESVGGMLAGGPFKARSVLVSAYDSSPMHGSITIAAGTRRGVRRGVAVAADGAVVGLVIEAGPWLSHVRLVTDPDSLLPCRVSRTRDVCVLKGTGGTACAVELIHKDASISKGDVLVTAPQDRLAARRPLIPSGLPVATVQRVGPGRADPLFLEVWARPRANLDRLEVVEVIIPVERGGDE